MDKGGAGFAASMLRPEAQRSADGDVVNRLKRPITGHDGGLVAIVMAPTFDEAGEDIGATRFMAGLTNRTIVEQTHSDIRAFRIYDGPSEAHRHVLARDIPRGLGGACPRRKEMIEFFFDCSSPFTYLGFHEVQRVAAECEAPVIWRPILVGGIFNTINPSVYAFRANPAPAKQAYMIKDLADWARLYGLTIRMPPTIFPINTVKAMRACIALEPEGKLVPFAEAVFRRYWSEDQDVSSDAVLAGICEEVAVDPDRLLAAIATDAVKAQLRRNTQELVDRGGFGTPTIFVNGEDMYFGNDRLGLVRDALSRRRSPSPAKQD